MAELYSPKKEWINEWKSVQFYFDHVIMNGAVFCAVHCGDFIVEVDTVSTLGSSVVSIHICAKKLFITLVQYAPRSPPSYYLSYSMTR